MDAKTTSLAIINGQAIVMIENGEKRIAVRPICEALGVSYQAQIEKLKTDQKFSSTVMLSITVGADGKQREMITIPYKKAFGWLYSINANNVKPEARENMIRYQEECNDALYNHFARHEEYLEYRDKLIAEKLAKYDETRLEFRNAKDRISEARERLDEARQLTEDVYFADQSQLRLNFHEFDERGKEA